ncbi:MAG: penicillin-binding transpeptidase domain-containing protein, partial [Acidimicrobiales bacterium]
RSRGDGRRHRARDICRLHRDRHTGHHRDNGRPPPGVWHHRRGRSPVTAPTDRRRSKPRTPVRRPATTRSRLAGRTEQRPRRPNGSPAARRPPTRQPPAAGHRTAPPATRRRTAGRPLAAGAPRRRLVCLLVVLVVAFGAVIVRLAAVQGPGGRRFAEVGKEQRVRTVALPAERGAIVDRNGEPLAISTRRRTVWADPQQVRDPAGAARALAPLLGVEESVIRAKLTSSNGFEYLARKVEDPVADAVSALRLAGVSLLEEPKRVDPGGPLAASLLGRVGLDDEGLSGLELQYDEQLSGTAGQLVVEKDPGGHDIASGTHELQAATPGNQLVLTLDRSMQFETERVLADQIVATRAKGGIAIVMDPTTGEVLAMASLAAGGPGGVPGPTPDNTAVTNVYEPGSVNKLVTVSAAIETGVISPTDTFVVADNMNVAGSPFRDAEPHATETMSVSEIVSESSNIGTITIGQRLGKERVDQFVRAFGLAERTALDFPGESGGLLPDPADYSGTSLATVTIGQGVAVTALQMLVAYNTIANGGVQVPPVLAKQIVDAEGRAHEVARPEPRRVVSEETAKVVVPMLEQVVADGTGTAAAVAGYSVAGKTGTAQKVRGDGAGYKDGAYLATFAGFLPARSPRLSAIIVLDEPTPIFGGVVSAPVFADLAGFGTRRLRIPPDIPIPSTGTMVSAGLRPADPSAAVSPLVPGSGAPAAVPVPTTTLGPTPTSRP